MRKKKLIIIVILVLLTSISVLVYIKKSDKNNSQTNADTALQGKSNNSEGKPSSSEGTAKTENPSSDTQSDSKKESQPTLLNIKTPQSQKWGNNPGNILNDGCFAFQDGYLYFYNMNLMQNSILEFSYPIYRTKEDGITALTKLELGSEPAYLNVVGEWIYFCTYGGLSRIKVNGSEREFIDSSPTRNLIIFDNVLYYIQDSKLYKRSINTLNEEELLAENVDFFTLSEDGKTIFYCPLDYLAIEDVYYTMAQSIYSIETNGENKKHIYTCASDTSIESIFTYKNYLYFLPIKHNFIDGTTESTTYIPRLDYTSSYPNAEQYIPLSGNLDKVNLYENYLYYVITDYIKFTSTIYRRNLEDDSVESLTINNVSNISGGIYCFGDKVYFVGYTSNFFQATNTFNLYCLDFQSKSILRNESPTIN